MPADLDFATTCALGAVQGLTEFLPVSSSGHVAMGAMLFGVSEETPLSLVIVLHLGTFLATVFALRGDIIPLARDTLSGLRDPKAFLGTESGRVVTAVVLGTLPTIVIGLGLKDHVEPWSRVGWIIGACLLGSAVTVISTRFATPAEGDDAQAIPTIRLALLVGVAQGLAVLPGLSRSGSTIAAAMLLGLSGPGAFRFSFLLSLPAIAGAVILELGDPDVFRSIAPSVWVGGAVAFVVGLVCLELLRGLVTRGRFFVFAFYLVPAGLGMIAWDLLS